MRNLFAFIYRYRGFLVFLLLEILCAYLIIKNNSYQGAAFYNSANAYAGRVLEFQREVADYFRLVEVNQALVAENKALQESLTNIMLSDKLDSIPSAPDSSYRVKPDSLTLARQKLDTTGITRTFKFVPGKVIKNSVRLVNNHLLLNIGRAQGVEPGMGVVSGSGVIGRVKAVSQNYSTIYSLLHSQMLVSAKVRRTNTAGTIRWEGDNYRVATLDYIPRHIKLVKGDTVVTSGYNAVFPEGIMIGRVLSTQQEPDKMFLTVRVRLSVDFDNLTYVYVINNTRRAERDSLEARSGIKEND
ncbi:rod shape-determining protein MreC [Adhaeribacter rhizoryzae]|uniref:Cell shape-determining protein MreC n=1 Tax=Adhaeribacter rhizoryzae TaxID=2607907 RepID=A0A5M6CZR2_9BACT|nr:rod shape-determining protein MreC [Adhaeribacter rhizoryzae]KAA5539522.1 rod shape-determining protein MreC [Adhaeribacter rhizoryzae]